MYTFYYNNVFKVLEFKVLWNMNTGLKVVIVLGILLLLGLVFIPVNNYYVSCTASDKLTLDRECSYDFAERSQAGCKSGELIEENLCVYDGKSLIEQDSVKYSLWGLGILFAIFLTWYIARKTKKTSEIQLTQFTDKDAKDSNRMKDIFYFNFAKDSDIPCWKDGAEYFIQTGAFEEIENYETFVLPDGGWRVQWNFECSKGNRPGRYTAWFNDCREEDWMEKNLVRWRRLSYDDFKIDKMHKPDYLLRDRKERILQGLFDANPDLAESKAGQDMLARAMGSGGVGDGDDVSQAYSQSSPEEIAAAREYQDLHPGAKPGIFRSKHKRR